MVGKIFAGERCVLHCAPGFKPAGGRTAVCDTLQNWSPSTDLSCIPAEPEPDIFKPYIRCPNDFDVILPRNEQTVRVRLEQPKTNVDWWE